MRSEVVRYYRSHLNVYRVSGTKTEVKRVSYTPAKGDIDWCDWVDVVYWEGWDKWARHSRLLSDAEAFKFLMGVEIPHE